MVRQRPAPVVADEPPSADVGNFATHEQLRKELAEGQRQDPKLKDLISLLEGLRIGQVVARPRGHHDYIFLRQLLWPAVASNQGRSCLQG